MNAATVLLWVDPVAERAMGVEPGRMSSETSETDIGNDENVVHSRWKPFASTCSHDGSLCFESGRRGSEEEALPLCPAGEVIDAQVADTELVCTAVGVPFLIMSYARSTRTFWICRLRLVAVMIPSFT